MKSDVEYVIDWRKRQVTLLEKFFIFRTDCQKIILLVTSCSFLIKDVTERAIKELIIK